MPNGEMYEGILEQNKIKADEVVQFERFGFARKDKDEKFYFTHK